jgi:hypothetical protein
VAPSATPTEVLLSQAQATERVAGSDTTTKAMAPATRPARRRAGLRGGTEEPSGPQRARLGTVHQRMSATGARQAVCGVLPPSGLAVNVLVVANALLTSCTHRDPSRPRGAWPGEPSEHS